MLCHRFLLQCIKQVKCKNLIMGIYTIQWGSKILTSPHFKWSKRSWFANSLWISKGILNPESQPFEIWTEMYGFLNGWDHSYN